MHFDNPLGNGKAEAGSTFFFCGGRIGLLELLENLVLIFFCYAGTGVTHG